MVSFFAGFALVALVLVGNTEAHSYMTDPMPTWSVGYPTTNYAGLIDGQDFLPVPKGMSYGGTPESNTEAYWTAFNASKKYSSLKDLADKTMVLQSLSPFGKATKECGFSLPNGTARALPAKVQWKDFGYSHQGPCEVWCDDKLAFSDTNCALHYPEVPANLPYDVDVCTGAKMMQSYWIALHGLPWQLYLNCVPLSGKVNGTDSAVAGESDAAQTPTTTTAPETTTESSSGGADTSTTTATDAPETTTESSSASADTSTPTATDAPETTTDAPEVQTPEVTPATPTAADPSNGAKCSRRRS
ncbi:hypothetical protein P3T76_010395 [Phytophthora citrophthora]|uniref:Uncharacterized protein n=1 Tax=Phytophthora citrophthora TaxID=4793 RepID=A0AAD9GCA6_9STRA|nr:hypothetical protein P3T76_010395 [Phytophthora citrophthora]